MSRLLYTKIPQIIYYLADFDVTGLDSALLCNVLFRILCENFFHSVNLSSSILVVKLIKIITVIMNQFSLTLYNFYVAPISIWVIKLIETIAVSLLCNI